MNSVYDKNLENDMDSNNALEYFVFDGKLNAIKMDIAYIVWLCYGYGV